MNELMSRRGFLGTTATVGAGLYLSPRALTGNHQSKQRDALHVGLIGAGRRGQALMDSVLRLSRHSPIHMRTVCDIWDKNRLRAAKVLNAYKAYGHQGAAYVDYRELLDIENNLDAVIVATPDFCHAEQTIAALNKGLHVYCEQPMSNTIEDARRMAETARDTGRLLQMGYQRRSNPKYILAFDKLIQEAKILGRITAVDGQWNRSRTACLDLGWPDGSELKETTLQAYGYASMHQFRNWRWYRNLGAGPVVGLGGQQIDVYNWFLEAHPRSIMATGGTDYWSPYRWYDNVIALYEYKTKYGIIRASHRLYTSNGHRGYFKQFVGDEGLLEMSEHGDSAVYREPWVLEEKWYPYEKQGILDHVYKTMRKAQATREAKSVVDVRGGSYPPKEFRQYKLRLPMTKPPHQAHLENFFAAIRGHEPLNCSANVGYASSVTALKINQAVETGLRIEFSAKDFIV